MAVVTMSYMELIGGEKDGYRVKLSSSSRPDVFYAVPSLDEVKIRNTKGNTAKSELRDRLAVLAYKFNGETSTDSLFRMDRAPELDRVPNNL